MKTVAVVSKPAKAELNGILPDLIQWLGARGYDVFLDEESASYGSNENVVPRTEIAKHNPRFVIVLGGDGTLLSAARAVGKAEIPLLGVNLGSLGFLTEVALDELYDTLTAVDAGLCPLDSRSVLQCSLVRDGRTVCSYYALNDMVVKSTMARLMGYDVRIDGGSVVDYKADGVIVATPTGSTAYSLAAGGPVLMPYVDAFVVTPICPHSLTHRPLVVGDKSVISVCLQSGCDGSLSVDGQVGMSVTQKDRIDCCKAPHKVKLLRMKKTFFDVLRNKLKWGQR